MSASDGTVLGVTQIRDRGPESLNYNIALLGDGFTAAEQSAYQAAASRFVTDLFSYEPFATEVSGEINVFRVDVESDNSGTTLVTTCPGGTGGTYFDARFCANGLDRLLTVDRLLVEDVLADWVPEWDAAIVIVNSAGYGGSGAAPVAVYSTGTPTTVPIHELGHAAFGLADEYEYWAGCGSGETSQNNHSGVEPVEPNVTTNTDRATLKWGSLVDPATPLPTSSNADCSQCDPQPNPAAAGTVGLFEGAQYFHCGIYRPEWSCMMRSNQPFCAVCARSVAGQVRQGALCFVAGAVYGDAWHPDVVALRRWRDRHLAPGARGRWAMQGAVAVYGRVGPPLARWTSRRPALAGALRRRMLGPLARRVAG